MSSTNHVRTGAGAGEKKKTVLTLSPNWHEHGQSHQATNEKINENSNVAVHILASVKPDKSSRKPHHNRL
jgi:hypothetical protein